MTAHHKMANSVGFSPESWGRTLFLTSVLWAMARPRNVSPNGVLGLRADEVYGLAGTRRPPAPGLDGSAASERTPSPAGVESEAHFGRYGRVA